ncbi:MAG: histidine phosphatase family protein [Gemmataceae bacterium]
MPTRVWLLRHAESATPGVFHGAESDVGLSDRGARQVQAIARHFASCRADVVVCSAMRRARLTAKPIAEACGLPLVVEPDLHERRVGVLQGTPTRPPDARWVETERHWSAGRTDFATPGAESFNDIRDRIVPVWQRITAKYADQSLIMVVHGIVIRVLLLSMLPGYSPADWDRVGPNPNLGVTELVGESGSWTALRMNEVPATVAATP